MIRLAFNLVLILINMHSVAQSCSYIYCVNDSFTISIQTLNHRNTKPPYFGHFVDDSIIASLNLGKYAYWLNDRFYITNQREKKLYYEGLSWVDTSLCQVKKATKDSVQVEGFYGYYGHMVTAQGNVFMTKLNGNYYHGYYIVHHIVAELISAGRLLNVDSTSHSSFTFYTYEFSNIHKQENITHTCLSPYLILVFCPQIGVISYNFIDDRVLNIHLEYINNQPLEYYYKNKLFLTLF